MTESQLQVFGGALRASLIPPSTDGISLVLCEIFVLPPPPQINVQGCISIGVSLYSGGGEEGG